MRGKKFNKMSGGVGVKQLAYCSGKCNKEMIKTFMFFLR